MGKIFFVTFFSLFLPNYKSSFFPKLERQIYFRYEYLRKLCYPLPSYRTLCERVSHLKVQSRVQHQILDFMETQSREDKSYCVLVLDEMQIMPGIEYDPTLRRFIGGIDDAFFKKTFETAEAKHALVFMAKGLFEKWKQIVGKKNLLLFLFLSV